MQTFRVLIHADTDKYPTEYIVSASDWPTAITTAIIEWKKRFKGSRAKELNIRALKAGTLLISDNKN